MKRRKLYNVFDPGRIEKLYLMVVQTYALSYDIQRHRVVSGTVVAAAAEYFPPGVKDMTADELAAAAKAYVDYQYELGERPPWMN